MPTAKEIAVELRKFADRLEKTPEAEMDKPYISFYYYRPEHKQRFINTARTLLHPLTKTVSSTDNPILKLEYSSKFMDVYTSIPQSFTCTLIEPAKKAVYRCDPILSESEDAELEADNA
jgi:hypothetical protein